MYVSDESILESDFEKNINILDHIWQNRSYFHVPDHVMKTDWCLKSIKTKLSKVHSRPYLNCDLLLFSRVLQLRTSLSAFSCTSKFYKIAIFLQIPMCFHNKSPKNLSFTYQRTFVRQSTIRFCQFIFSLSFNQSQHIYTSTRIFEFQKKVCGICRWMAFCSGLLICFRCTLVRWHDRIIIWFKL